MADCMTGAISQNRPADDGYNERLIYMNDDETIYKYSHFIYNDFDSAVIGIRNVVAT